MKSEIEIIYEGKKVTGTMEVSGGMVTVSNPTLGRKSASTSANNEVLAKIMLREIVQEAKRKGWE